MSINLKLRGRLFAMVSLALAGMLIIGVIALASLRAELLHDRELKTKDLVDAAASIATTFAAKAAGGTMTDEAARQAALEAISILRYDGNNYFWVNSLDGTLLQHPNLPARIGKSVLDLRDADGMAMFAEFCEVARSQGGGSSITTGSNRELRRLRRKSLMSRASPAGTGLSAPASTWTTSMPCSSGRRFSRPLPSASS